MKLVLLCELFRHMYFSCDDFLLEVFAEPEPVSSLNSDLLYLGKYSFVENYIFPNFNNFFL